MPVLLARDDAGPAGLPVTAPPMAVSLTTEQFSAYAHHSEVGEVVMSYLLHFTETEAGQSRPAEDVRRECGDSAISLVEGRGGRVLWMGQPELVRAGDDEVGGWDMAVLVSFTRR